MEPTPLARVGKRIGVTAGAFDLCHAGHILMFKEAKEQCDYLIVFLHDNPAVERPNKNTPVMGLQERRIILEGIKYIDEIIEYKTEQELFNLLCKVEPDVRIIGWDWKGKEFTGYELPIRVHFNRRDHGFSTTELRQRIWEREKKIRLGDEGRP